MSESTTRPLDRYLRGELADVLSSLLPHPAEFFRGLSDADLLHQARSLPDPLGFTGPTLKSIKRVTELLVESEIDPEEKTRSEYELEVNRLRQQRWVDGLLGFFIGGAFCVFTLLVAALTR
jgi:hypothetical protein